MQVKNFGRSGRTKWTHLVDQDTTTKKNKDGSLAYVALKCAKMSYTFTNPFNIRIKKKDEFDPYKYTPELAERYRTKMGGMGSVDNALRRKRKTDDL